MSIIGFKQVGDFKDTNKFLKSGQNISEIIAQAKIEEIAQQGAEALSAATPVRTGKTAASWSYKIENTNGKTTVLWTNDNVVNGVNIAIIIQYGHGTRNGGYVEGYDYINPALKPVFDQMTDSMWKAVVSL